MTPPSAESSSWAAATAALRQVAKLSEGLALVIVTGPGTHAPEGLERLAASLPPERVRVWHRLDQAGADLAGTLEKVTAPSVLLVHGLERLATPDRREVSVRLNLLRDTLSGFPSVVLLWVPRESLDEFRQLCSDLFHWRALLLVVEEEDVPVPRELVARRRYLGRVEESMARPIAILWRRTTLASVYVEPRVQPAGESPESALAFSQWAQSVDHGLLLGPAGSGKTAALEMLTLKQARLAATDLTVPVPIFVSCRHLDPEFRPRLANLLPEEMAEGLDAESCEALAANLFLLLDGVDEIPESWRPAVLGRLREVLSTHSEMRCIATSRRAYPELESWNQGQLLPWDLREIREFLRLGIQDQERASRLLGLLERRSDLLEMARLPLLLSFLVRLYEVADTQPLGRSRLLRYLVDAQLAQRDAAKMLGRLRASMSPSGLEEALAELALKRLRAGTPEIPQSDFAEVGLDPSDVQYLEARAALIVKRGGGKYAFATPIFSAYFAAQGLLLLPAEDAERELINHLDSPEWRDTFLLAASEMAPLRGARWLWERFWPRDEGLSPQQTADRMALALEIALEAVLTEGLLEHGQKAAEYLQQVQDLPAEPRARLEEILQYLEA